MNPNAAADAKPRKVVAGPFFSLNGVVEAPDQPGFQYFDDGMTEMIVAVIARADAVLVDPRTYAVFAQWWPNHSNEVPRRDFELTTYKLKFPH